MAKAKTVKKAAPRKPAQATKKFARLATGNALGEITREAHRRMGRGFVSASTRPRTKRVGSALAAALREETVEPKLRVKLTPGMVIREIREKKNMTQADLAKATGIAQAAISGLESDGIVLGLARAKLLARALGVHPAVIAFPDWEMESVA